jgi:transposase-like protein
MNAEQPTKGRRVCRRYSAEDRSRLIAEHASSGLSKKGFCAQRGINLGTFTGWRNLPPAKKQTSGFTEVDMSAALPAAVEILLPNGVRIGIRHQGKQDALVALVRGVAGPPPC